MANEVALRPATPMIPVDQIELMAERMAKSRLFGMQSADQVFALMMIAQAEGRHPALAARDYHIINGSPAKKAEAMARDFLGAGGRIEWHELSDTAADATFSHPAGGSARIRWDQARVSQAGLGGNGMHKKYPRQMLRSRVVSEGVRTVWPTATSGMYVPEEVAEFAPQRAEPIDVTPKTQLDSFAAPAAEIVDAETGEVVDLHDKALAVAWDGTEAFRAWWRTLDRSQRDELKPAIGELQRTAQDADARRAAEGDDDPFGLSPIEPSPPSPLHPPAVERPGDDGADSTASRQGGPQQAQANDGPERSPAGEAASKKGAEREPLADPHSTTAAPAGERGHNGPASKEGGNKVIAGLQEAVAYAKGEATDTRVTTVNVPTDLLGGQPAENLYVPLPARPVSLATPEGWAYYARQLLSMIDEAPLNRQRAAQIRMQNEHGLAALKTHAQAEYDAVQRALAEAR